MSRPIDTRTGLKIYKIGDLVDWLKEKKCLPYPHNRGCCGNSMTTAKIIAENFMWEAFGSLLATPAGKGKIQVCDAHNRIKALSIMKRSGTLTNEVRNMDFCLKIVSKAKFAETHYEINRTKQNYTVTQATTNPDNAYGGYISKHLVPQIAKACGFPVKMVQAFFFSKYAAVLAYLMYALQHVERVDWSYFAIQRARKSHSKVFFMPPSIVKVQLTRKQKDSLVGAFSFYMQYRELLRHRADKCLSKEEAKLIRSVANSSSYMGLMVTNKLHPSQLQRFFPDKPAVLVKKTLRNLKKFKDISSDLGHCNQDILMRLESDLRKLVK